MSRGGVRTLAVGVLALAASGSMARAQRSTPDSRVARTAERQWPAPLDRRVSLQLDGLSLRDALDSLAATASLRLSYSAELLPLDRTVRAAWESTPAGAILATLLAGTSVEPLPVGSDQVVLAPSLGAADADDPSYTGRPAHTLQRIVVTERASRDAVAPRAVSVDVVRPDAIVANPSGTIARALDGAVPGIWLWEQSPASVVARYGSIRGASSFGASAPKVYIDGIEVADPLLLTRFPLGGVDRIEVIRGPQGAALYGAGAIGGVVNIVTRHDGVDDGAPRAELRSEIGAARSDFAAGGVLTQEHELLLRSGTSLGSANATLTFGGVGDFYPGANGHHLAATGGFRVIGTHSSITGFARLFSEHSGAATGALLAGPATGAGAPAAVIAGQAAQGTPASSTPLRVRQYTLGTTVQLVPDEHITNTLVVGIDGYRMDAGHASASAAPAPAAAWAMLSTPAAADRVTMRASSAGRFGAPERAGITITAAAEQSVLRQAPASLAERSTSDGSRFVPFVGDWFGTSGLTIAADLALRGTLYFTGGVRYDRTEGFASTPQHALLPLIGGALVRHAGGATITLRSAYGKAIRPPGAEGVGGTGRAGVGELAPEVQSGIEAGVDLSVGRALSLRLTRFDQRASGLIQRVPVAGDPSIIPALTLAARFRNVGEVANRGWEVQGAAAHGALSLSGAMSFVDSRVRQVGEDFVGGLRPGDRMLEVPASTVSLTTGFNRLTWSAAVSASRAFDWIGYDQPALSRALASGDILQAEAGAPLRDYWRRYDGFTHLRATASRALGRGFTGTLTVDNLLDRQVGEPDDLTVVPGRTISAALRVTF